MKNKEIFALLSDYRRPNPIATYGANLSKQLSAPLRLIAVETLSYSNMPTEVTGDGLSYPQYLKMEQIKSKNELALRDVTFDTKDIWRHTQSDFSIGFPESKAIQLTEKIKPQLLILEGKNDLSTLNEWFGTYETRIAEDANCPVLVLPEMAKWHGVSKILYVMDPDDNKVSNMRRLADLAAGLDAALQVVMIMEKPNSKTDEGFDYVTNVFQNLLQYRKVTYHKIYGERKAEEIENLMAETRPDWLAVEQKDKSFFERIFDDYNTKRIILQSEKPVLVF